MPNIERLERREIFKPKEREPMPFAHVIVALDVDGVLVDPRAYRQAGNKTIVYYGNELGIDPKERILDDKNTDFGRSMSHFEANGIHDPWDAACMIVSLMLLEREGISISNGEALEIYQKSPDKTYHPPDVLLEELNLRYREKVSVKTMRGVGKTLTKTRDPFTNEVTSVFQEYVLGGTLFEDTYGKKAKTDAVESLIETQDRLLIRSSGRNCILEIAGNGGKIVIYTGRPGLAPEDIEKTVGSGYPPEAELAIKKARISSALGAVTMGTMEWLGRETHTPVQDLTKPNPTQALAAILSALRGKTDSQILRDAYEWVKNNRVPKEIQDLIHDTERKTLEIVVAEDSLSGVVAFVNARKILAGSNLDVKIVTIGVHGGDYEKFSKFKKLASQEQIDVITCTNINEGLDEYLLLTKYEGRIDS